MPEVQFESLYPDTAWEQEIGKLSTYIKEGTSVQLLSIPGAGRSTILRLLAHNKKLRAKHFGPDQKNIHFVPVHFSEIKKRPLFDVTKFLFLSLADSLRERNLSEYQKINTLLKKSLVFNDELVLFQALKEAIDYLALEKKLKIVFLFDRFEEYVPVVTNEFFTNLRTLRNRAKYQFSVVFSLNRPLEEFLEQDLLFDFYEFIAGHHVYTGLFDKATTDFRVGYIEKITGKKIPPKTLERIIAETGGVGRLIKLSVEAVLSEQKSEIRSLKDFLYSQKPIQNALMEICRSLLPVEQQALIKNNFSDEKARNYLETIGVTKNNEIQIPLFEKHIQMHREGQNKDINKIIYDENTNTIKMGETVLSDRLTRSEFRLLSFLLNNPERIIDRDEIINIVWSDQKSTAGITDQAVDQLIFRLRRKIEKDPNSPNHLHTVKGRGFKFSV